MHTPFCAKQPEVRLKPPAPVEVAEPVMLRAPTLRPLVKVEVPTPKTFKSAVEVAPPKMVRPPAWVPLPIVDEAVAKMFPRNEVPDTEIAVDEANGNCDAVCEVALNESAVGVELATTLPLASVESRPLVMPENHVVPSVVSDDDAFCRLSTLVKVVEAVKRF